MRSLVLKSILSVIFALGLSFAQSAEQTPLADAAEKQDWKSVESLVDSGTKLDAPQVDGMTALHWASYHDEAAVIEKLVNAGADVSVKNRYDVSPLSLACVNGNETAVRLFLKSGASANTTLNGGETVLMTAARTGNLEVVKALTELGAKIDSIDRKGQTALMWAASEGNADVIRFLIDTGSNPNATTKNGFTPILFASRDGRTEAVRTLLKSGVDVNRVMANERAGGKAPPRGTTPLRLAVENGHFELAVALLEAGADPNDQLSGHAPLHVLTWVRKPNRGDGNDGAPPPIGSGKMTSLDFAKIIITKFKADPNLPLKKGTAGGTRLGTRGATPFLLAAKTADLPYLKLLADLGADFTIPNANGTTPLMAAAGLGTYAPTEEAGTETECIATVGWLLEKGAKINFLNKNGDSIMHGAAYKSLPKMVSYLAENGADINFWNQKNKRGHTPLLIAQGFRQGNFKPAPATIEAIQKVMRANGLEPPPAPKRPIVGKPKAYQE